MLTVMTNSPKEPIYFSVGERFNEAIQVQLGAPNHFQYASAQSTFSFTEWWH